MTLRAYEAKLQSANPALRLKRASWGAMGVYAGSKFICRISDREITPYTISKKEYDNDVNLEGGLNALGGYTWFRLQHRGRRAIATILYERKLISHLDKAKLS